MQVLRLCKSGMMGRYYFESLAGHYFLVCYTSHSCGRHNVQNVCVLCLDLQCTRCDCFCAVCVPPGSIGEGVYKRTLLVVWWVMVFSRTLWYFCTAVRLHRCRSTLYSSEWCTISKGVAVMLRPVRSFLARGGPVYITCPLRIHLASSISPLICSTYCSLAC